MCHRTIKSLAWMSDLFKRMGDYMPHKTLVHLPHTWTKRLVYERMTRELVTQNELPGGFISYEHFTRIWQEKLPQFTIPNSTDFSKCTTCTQLQEAYEKSSSEDQRQKISGLKASHDKFVEAERRAYHLARERARREPHEMTCMIIDGMDQSKTDIPHLIVKDKDSASLARLPVHFTGVLLHTSTAEGKMPFVFHDVKHIPHDSNLTIYCLTEALKAAQDYLGKVLFLQMDNCFRENKNKFVLSFAALLVERDIFEEVYIHFLPVGHTHEDVDQMFSCVARHLNHTNVYTLEDLEIETAKSFTPHIDVRAVTAIPNVKSVLDKHLYGHFANHSKPHWFRFRKVQQRCYMHYKKWESSQWKPEECEELPHGLLCLKDVPDLSQSMEWVEPNLDKLDLPKLVKELPKNYCHRLPPSAEEWWVNFMANVSSTYDQLPLTQPWNLSALLKTFGQDRVTPTESSAFDAIISNVDASCPEIFIGDQGRPHKRVALMDSYASVESGVLVAVHCEEKEGRPFIGEVIERNDENVLVQWMKGSYSGAWQFWVAGTSKQPSPYTSCLPVSSLILWDFTLTKGRKLKKLTVETLKASYRELDAGTAS
ncbi:uncharacterized protein [Apostichopus japonicus]